MQALISLASLDYKLQKKPALLVFLFFDIIVLFLLTMDLTQGHRYTIQQKLSFTMMLIFGILIVVLGFLQMRNTIYTPFVIRESDFGSPEGALFENEQVKLQSIDTDHDGLNDYEELNFYSTSPYLHDSDSDGVEDQTEIVNRTDPNCPEGKKCLTSENSVTTSTQGLTPVLGEQTGIGSDPGSIPPPQITDDLATLSRDPQKLREMMLRTGTMTKEELDSVSDSTILQLAQNLVAQQFGVTSTPASSSTAPSL